MLLGAISKGPGEDSAEAIAGGNERPPPSLKGEGAGEL
jgi:hypothetical protein